MGESVAGIELLVLFPLWLTAFLAAGVASYLARFRGRPGVLPAIALLLSCSWWCLTYSAELMTAPGRAKEIWVALEFLGIYAIPAYYFVLAVHVSRQRLLQRPTLLYLVALFPLLEAALVWTNDWHGQIFLGRNYIELGSLVLLKSEFGPLFWVLAWYNYLLTFSSMGMLIWFAFRGEKYGRKMRLLIVLSALLPVFGNMLYVFGVPPFHVLDPSPYACGLSTLILTYAVFGLDMVDALPVARSATFQYMPVPYFVLDKGNRIVDYNDAALEVLVKDLVDPIASRFVEAVDAPDALNDFLELGEDGGHLVELQGRNGASRVYQCAVTHIHDGRDRVRCRVIHLEDVTDAERATERLREAKDAAENANTANTAKSQFLATMSHELRTPLNAINGFSEILSMEYDGALNESQRESIGHIRESGEHLLGLIEDLLDVSKIDSGVIELTKELIPVEPLLETAQSMAEKEIALKRLSLEVSCEDGLAVLGDLPKCRQILFNLVGNAVKFTPNGGNVWLSASVQDESFVRISVRDTGPGIALAEQENIFTEFYQSDNVRDAALGGSGIGLALVRRLVEVHGGRVGVESAVGSGSTFWFTLPAVVGSMSEHAGREVNGVGRLLKPESHRILVVDDDYSSLMVTCGLLRIHEHEIEVARNGIEAISLARQFRPDLIFMDATMPVMDGLEATRHLKESELRDIPIVVLSAGADAESVRACMAAGCDLHLAKPIGSHDLLGAIQSFLGGS